MVSMASFSLEQITSFTTSLKNNVLLASLPPPGGIGREDCRQLVFPPGQWKLIPLLSFGWFLTPGVMVLECIRQLFSYGGANNKKALRDSRGRLRDLCGFWLLSMSGPNLGAAIKLSFSMLDEPALTFPPVVRVCVFVPRFDGQATMLLAFFRLPSFAKMRTKAHSTL